MSDDQLNIEQIEILVSQSKNEKARMIWNAAIEAAAKCVDKDTRYDQAGYAFGPADKIRMIKK